MTKCDELYFKEELESIMETAEPMEKRAGNISFSIHAPCSIQVLNGDCTGDHVDVHIHSSGGSENFSIAEFIEASVAGSRHGESRKDG